MTCSAPSPARSSQSRTQVARRGSVYLLALIITAILTTVGLTSIAITTRARETSTLRQSTGVARSSVASGLDLALHRINLASNWRVLYSATPIIDAETIGSGTVTVTGSAVDASITSDVIVNAEATSAGTFQSATANFRPNGIAMDGLQSALHTRGDILFENAFVYADGPITSNEDIQATTSEIDAAVEAAFAITGTTFLRTTQQNADPRTMPDATIIDTLAADAVWIPFDQLPSGRIENLLLSPTSQPFTGETHPDGLYAIDCGSADITLRTCRIVGTLILLNVGSSSKIDKSVLIQPARSDYPSLLVQGSIIVSIDSVMLQESQAGVNLNPPATPYQGSFDTAIDDTYPSEIRGVVFVSDTLATAKRAAFRGAVFAGTLDCRGSLSIRHNASLETKPPVGFVDHYIYEFVPGSWEKTVR